MEPTARRFGGWGRRALRKLAQTTGVLASLSLVRGPSLVYLSCVRLRQRKSPRLSKIRCTYRRCIFWVAAVYSEGVGILQNLASDAKWILNSRRTGPGLLGRPPRAHREQIPEAGPDLPPGILVLAGWSGLSRVQRRPTACGSVCSQVTCGRGLTPEAPRASGETRSYTVSYVIWTGQIILATA